MVFIVRHLRMTASQAELIQICADTMMMVVVIMTMIVITIMLAVAILVVSMAFMAGTIRFSIIIA